MMHILKKLILSKDFFPLLIISLFVLLASRYLIFGKGYFNMHDDLQMMRQLEMEKCFKDGQVPCRWVQDMGYGYGFPLFNFYPPLPYLVGEIFRILGFSFVMTIRLVFALSFLISGIAMYFLAKEFFGRAGGIVSSIFYVWAPYHSVDIYVRGAMNEVWALSFFPLIFLAAYKLIIVKEKRKYWIIMLSLSLFALLTSHNLMVIIFSPVLAVWCLIFLLKNKNWWKLVDLAKSVILAISLAAFFSLPVFIEQKYVQMENLVQGYYEYVAHFASIRQILFSRFWGYGPSVWEDINDKMSFQIGHVHWILSILILGWFVYILVKKLRLKFIIHNSLFIIPFLILVGWFSLFMTHSRSTFIWIAIPQLKIVQFPWRFLSIATFAFSFLAGACVLFFQKKFYRNAAITLLILFLVIFNWNYFKPERMGALTDAEKFSGAAWDLQRNAGIYDYLPKTAKTAPKNAQASLAEIINGKGVITNATQTSYWGKFNIEIDNKEALVRINIFEFPNWKVYLDGKEINHFVDKNEEWGRMYVVVPQGKHKIYIQLLNTPIRTIANYISLFTWFGLIIFLITDFKKTPSQTRRECSEKI